jgi:hypothetical protein
LTVNTGQARCSPQAEFALIGGAWPACDAQPQRRGGSGLLAFRRMVAGVGPDVPGERIHPGHVALVVEAKPAGASAGRRIQSPGHEATLDEAPQNRFQIEFLERRKGAFPLEVTRLLAH